jgi:GxGxDxHG motif protein
MPHRRFLTEFGLGTSLRRKDYTEAALRGVKEALWHNSINPAALSERDKSETLNDVEIGVAAPSRVDLAASVPFEMAEA